MTEINPPDINHDFDMPDVQEVQPLPPYEPQMEVNVQFQEEQPIQQVVIIKNAQLTEPTCSDVFCGCQAPVFRDKGMQFAFGFIQAFCGSGLTMSTCCCCYGCDRPSCCPVWCAGICIDIGFVYIYGFVVSLIVGFKMMCM